MKAMPVIGQSMSDPPPPPPPPPPLLDVCGAAPSLRSWLDSGWVSCTHAAARKRSLKRRRRSQPGPLSGEQFDDGLAHETGYGA